MHFCVRAIASSFLLTSSKILLSTLSATLTRLTSLTPGIPYSIILTKTTSFNRRNSQRQYYKFGQCISFMKLIRRGYILGHKSTNERKIDESVYHVWRCRHEAQTVDLRAA